MTTVNLLELATGALIAGESIALYIGMGRKSSEWTNPTNNAYVAFDVLIGALLFLSSNGFIPTQKILVASSIITHLIRDYDYYRKVPDRYTFNAPLLIVLNIRLLMLIIILVQ